MRFALWAIAALAACQSSSQPDVRRDPSGIADQSTADMPPRGVEAENSTGNVPPSDGGYYIPGSRAQQVARQEEALRTPPPEAPADKDVPDGGLAVTVAADETGPCATDADCTSTRVPAGGCCATLCDARALTKARAEELQQRATNCGSCPVPLCRPSRSYRIAACVEGRCKMKVVESN